jgi:hypothetical protein
MNVVTHGSTRTVDFANSTNCARAEGSIGVEALLAL